MGKDYMTQLSKWARWMLPRQEAEDVIADYHDITTLQPRSREELIRDLGHPWSVIKSVAQPRLYRKWLAAFGTLAVCVVFPTGMAWKMVYWNRLIDPAYVLFFCLGVGLSLRIFRRNGVRKEKLPSGIVPLLALILVGIAGILFLSWLVLTESWDLLNGIAPTIERAQTVHLLLCLGTFVMALTSLWGLVNARVDDRRWCAVYIWGLCGVLLGLSLELLLRSTDLTVSGGQASVWMRYALITILGLIGTGVALC